MPATDLPLLIDAARAAGQIAMLHWRADPKTWKKSDDSPVSAADLDVDAALRDALCGARPRYGWLSEESPDDGTRLGAEHCFIVDPIDGTRAYLDGQVDWGLSLAVAEGGQITAGVVHMPAKDLTYTAAIDEGAFLNGEQIGATSATSTRDATLLTSKATYASANWKEGVPHFSRKFRPSMAYRMALVGEGRYDAMMTLKLAWEWDIAAGSLIAAEAGAIVTDRRGGPLRFNSETRRTNGVLAAPAGLHAAILDALA
ncbi:myo-inositol-1(or 4)-monophosphatase [Palleronia aestuarii]|uniref:Myo-inositol-1(Or 4)-monophosphatase n=1 Tax=Palleronia aestuarii TaxID=568105 RepID=A0A2W7N7Y7_9RHOB|nr:3'(2'),5'-bisphosphate nucleotidase CysQ [Palleronia aestuarii]PZX16525.1 myo-inositol-1(or 4)-monophosphatase [Palleronia aestuarii]